VLAIETSNLAAPESRKLNPSATESNWCALPNRLDFSAPNWNNVLIGIF